MPKRNQQNVENEENKPLPEELDFMRLLWQLNHSLEKTSRRMMGVVGITAPQRLAIRVVGMNPGISPGDLARTLHLHPSTVTGMLQRLEKSKLLRRQFDKGDRRRAHLYLTPRGQELTVPFRGSVEDCVVQLLSSWSRPQLRVTIDTLADLAKTLDDRRAKMKGRPAGERVR